MKNVQINNNGDDVDVLLGQVREARQAIVEAQAKLAQVTIHGRNYQTCQFPLSSFDQDRNTHAGMLQQLTDQSDILWEWFQVLNDQKRS